MSKMNLDRQLQALIDGAPQEEGTAIGVAAIAPVLKALASQLKSLDYYIFQTLDQEWVMTTLSNRTQPDVEKNVVYAFATLKDASTLQSKPDPQLIAQKVPVIDLLFQLLALDLVDSIVFFDTPGNLASGIEVRRQDLQSLIQTQLQQSPSLGRKNSRPLPPDIA